MAFLGILLPGRSGLEDSAIGSIVVSVIVEMENKLIVIAIEEKDTGIGNGRKGDLVGEDASF